MLSVFLVRETHGHVTIESTLQNADSTPMSARDVFWKTTLLDRNLSAVTQAGLVNNLNDGMAWGLFPLLFAAADISASIVSVLLAAIYPATWSIGQLATGALSDRFGRKWLIAGRHVGPGRRYRRCDRCQMDSPALPSAPCCSELVRRWCTRRCLPRSVTWQLPHGGHLSVGVYRLWRDLGYAVGAVVAGLTADSLGLKGAMWLIAGITFLSGVIVSVRMDETLRRRLA